MKKVALLLAVLLCLALAMPAMAEKGGVEIPTELPRNETIYYAGLQWGKVLSWNLFGSNQNNALAGIGGARKLVFETLYMYNLLDGQLYPLLAEGQPVWNDDMTELTMKINPAAHFSDGTPLTANDFAATFAAHVKYETSNGINIVTYISDMVALDDYTLVFKATLNDEGGAVNPNELLNQATVFSVTSAAWIEKLDAKVNGDKDAFKNDTALDFVGSGPYAGGYYEDDQKVVVARDDNYWGVALWGKLPVPKYIAHVLYPDNAAGTVALEAGQVDVSQQFNANVQDLWLVKGLPISTFIDKPPYQLGLVIPTAFYNLNTPVLQIPEVRKAIAMAVDYDQINANAMTYQSATFADVPRSLMNPTPAQQNLYDHDAVKDLQFTGKDIEGAKKLLDEAGIVDTDGDGWRDYNGAKISLNAVCPNGWTDWNASMEIVAAAGKDIGIEITTFFPESSEFYSVFSNANQTQYDIFMQSVGGASPTYPWHTVRQVMSGEFLGQNGNFTGNYGQYVNPRVDEIIAAIPSTTDPEALKALYTEAVKIYLTDVPSFGLMYRPSMFHTVNESVWTNFPEQGDAFGYPPTCLVDEYGIGGLYELELVNP